MLKRYSDPALVFPLEVHGCRKQPTLPVFPLRKSVPSSHGATPLNLFQIWGETVGMKTPDPGHNSCFPSPRSKCNEDDVEGDNSGVCFNCTSCSGGETIVGLAALVVSNTLQLDFHGDYIFKQIIEHYISYYKLKTKTQNFMRGFLVFWEWKF